MLSIRKILSICEFQILLKKPFYQQLFVFSLIFICFFGSIASFATEQCEVKIFTRNSRVNLKDIKSFFRTIDIVVSRILPSTRNKKSKPAIYTVILINDKTFNQADILYEKNKGTRFYLPEDINQWLNNDEILAKIAAAVLLKKCGYANNKNYEKLPSWLIYSIVSKVKRRFDKSKIPGIMTFPGIHMLLTSGKPPDLLKIASSPVSTGDGPAYKITVEASEIMLASINRLPDHKTAIKDLVDLSMQGIPPENSFKKIFSKKVHNMLQNASDIAHLQPRKQSEKELKDWLIDNATLMAVNAFKPGNTKFAEKKFREIEIVRYIFETKKDKVHEERYCKAEYLNEKKDEIKNFPSVVRLKELEFARLEFSVPTSLQPSLFRIKKALYRLRIDSSYNFKKEFLEAKKEFYDQLEKYNEIEVYLKKIEPRFIPESWRYRNELKEINKFTKQKRKRWPSLTKYLDSFEKE